MKNIEVELRGPLNNEEYNSLCEYLESNGDLIGKENRFLLDYSTFKEGVGERKLDVRVRITNGKPEIVVKKGRFGGASREEGSVFLEGSSLKSAVHLMSLLGYTKAVACDRGIIRYNCDGVEVAIQDVRYFPKKLEENLFARFFEVEIISDESNKVKDENKILAWVKDRKLSLYSEDEWVEFVELMNTKANGVFDYHTNSFSEIADCGADER